MEEKIASEESKALLRETARAFSAVTTNVGIDPVALSSSQFKNGKGSNSELDKGLNSNNNVRQANPPSTQLPKPDWLDQCLKSSVKRSVVRYRLRLAL